MIDSILKAISKIIPCKIPRGTHHTIPEEPHIRSISDYTAKYRIKEPDVSYELISTHLDANLKATYRLRQCNGDQELIVVDKKRFNLLFEKIG